MDFLKGLFETGDFMSHGHCYLWLKSLVRLHLFSDFTIGLSYVFISLALVHLVRRAQGEIPFHWMFLAFGSFIIACGATHFMEVWTLWTPVYWLSGAVKAVTACVSALTAFTLPPLIPKSLDLLRAARLSEARKAELEASNSALQQEVLERKRAEEQVRRLNAELEERVRERTDELRRAAQSLAEKAAIVEHSHDAIYSETLEGVITSWNPAAEKLYGYTAAEIVGQNIRLLAPADRLAELDEAIAKVRAGSAITPFETVRVTKDGTAREVYLTISPIKDIEERIIGASVIARDVTERNRTERQMRETQKLESLGLIAGGVAHDFNNLLVGIIGNASLVVDSMPASNPNRALLQNVVTAGEKASNLTRQLLAYAGKGRFETALVNLSVLVREISGLIQTSIPKNVQLRLELAPELPLVQADPGQLQQLIMNLVINGAEAIPGNQNGAVLVTTATQDVDEAFLANNFAGESVAAGRYVCVEVHDSGVGMTDEVRARIFDPFFSTKFAGRGLGLAAVLGIVRGHKGIIRVYSIPGKGTTFKVLLPSAEGHVSVPAIAEVPEELRGSATILVVDDEEIVRVTGKAALQRYGYTVLTASDGREGVEMLRAHAGSVGAVILDMTMPVMSGEEAFRRMRLLRPDVPVIVSSGYNEVEAILRFTSKGIAAFIQKPYTAAKLAAVVKRALENKKA